jgi:MarR family transcriptional regulator, 2-MHQ and catechol-resistance regulon repressor
VRCEKDHRVLHVALAGHETRTLAALDGPLAAPHHTLPGHLSQAELKELIRLLEKAREEPLTADA